MEPSDRERAADLFRQAYEAQMRGALPEAIGLYKRSLEVCPTAEAHTFLGWTYSFQGRLDDAIEECKRAIEVDPDFGNPYNDTGAYLIELGRHLEAIPWLEQATRARRYEPRHFPWLNLGRAYAALEMFSRAVECFEKAAALNPDDPRGAQAAAALRRQLN